MLYICDKLTQRHMEDENLMARQCRKELSSWMLFIILPFRKAYYQSRITLGCQIYNVIQIQQLNNNINCMVSFL